MIEMSCADLSDEFRRLHTILDRCDVLFAECIEEIARCRDHVTAEVRAARDDLSQRIRVVENLVLVDRITLQEIRADVADLRRRFDRLERDSDLEKRVAEVEKRLGIR